jgi:hypothetical protein
LCLAWLKLTENGFFNVLVIIGEIDKIAFYKGIQANGGIGLKVKNIGLTNASIFLLAPIRMPSKIPKEEETKNPAVTRMMLCKIC